MAQKKSYIYDGTFSANNPSVVVYERRISRLMISRGCSSTVYGQVMSLFLLFILNFYTEFSYRLSVIYPLFTSLPGTCIYSWPVSTYLLCKGIESNETRVSPSEEQKWLIGRIRRRKRADPKFRNLPICEKTKESSFYLQFV